MARKLGSYVIEREIGRGGMGEVLLARHERLGRPVILKRTLRGLAGRDELAERLEREARAAGMVHHQNVVAVYDLFTHRGARYIAQEYVAGVDLAGALLCEGPFPWEIAARIGLEVARGLEAVHAHGTLHRDLKPANLLLGRNGAVKIGDFGLALDANATPLTQPGVVVGTPAYMAPEQLRCGPTDARTDLFAWGCVVYEMLTGRPPFYPPGPATTNCPPLSPAALTARIERGDYHSVRRAAHGVPRRFARLIARCLRARTTRRPATTQQVRQTLEAMLNEASPADCQEKLAGWLRRHGLVEPTTGDTALDLTAPLTGNAPRGLRPWAAAAALAAAAAALTLAGPKHLTGLLEDTTSTARELGHHWTQPRPGETTTEHSTRLAP